MGWDDLEIENNEFTRLSIEYKKAEQEYNQMKVVLAFVKDTNKETDYKLLAQSIQIEYMILTSYIEKRKTEGANDESISDEVKNSIVSLITQILNKE